MTIENEGDIRGRPRHRTSVRRLEAVSTTIVTPLPADPAAALAVLEGLAAQPEQTAHEIVLVEVRSPALAPLLARVEGDVEVARIAPRAGLAAAAAAGLERAGD